jgi:hypothetical protein
MKSVLIVILIGVILGVVFFALAGFSDGACHCVKPTIVFFPYAGIALGLSWESVSLPLIALQFPAYSVLIAKARGAGWRILAFLVLIFTHAVAVAVGLRLNH